jgi:hypothetical protein
MDSSAGQAFDHLLAELAQPDAVAGKLGISGRNAEEIAALRRMVHAQQQIRGGQVEEAECVRLNDLAEVEDAAQLSGGFRDGDRQQLIARLGRGQRMADRTDAAGAGRQRRHLEKWASLDEFFKTADLGDLETGVADGAVLAQQEADPGMPFDAGDRLDDELLFHHGLLRRRTGC